MPTDIIFGLLILFISVILHEVAHGYMANWLGDPTARLQGRLTLNPVSHTDPIGTILLPLILTLSNSPIFFGYAKPVPYNPHNLPGKYDEALVAFAGPAVNLLLAALFGLIIRFAGAALPLELMSAFAGIVYINLLLALFNLIPLPPLDGSKVLGGLFAALSRDLARHYETFLRNFERIGMLPMILITIAIFYLFLLPFLQLFLGFFFSLLTGVAA